MFRSKIFSKPCPVSKQLQQVTVYFENTATNGIQDLNDCIPHHFVCDNQDCPAKLNSHACPIFKSAHA